MDEQDPFLPPSAASQAIAARTLRNQGSYNAPSHPASSLKRLPSSRNAIEPSPSMPHRYTSLSPNPFALNLSNEAKDFQKYLKSTSNVYYDPSIPDVPKRGKNEEAEEEVKEDSPSYGYYSSIPINSGLSSRSRAYNYGDRDNEFETAQWVQRQLSQNSTLESTWSPKNGGN